MVLYFVMVKPEQVKHIPWWVNLILMKRESLLVLLNKFLMKSKQTLITYTLCNWVICKYIWRWYYL